MIALSLAAMIVGLAPCSTPVSFKVTGKVTLSPALAMTGPAAYAKGNLWVAMAGGHIWRFGADGQGESYTLPDSIDPIDIMPRGGTADVLTDDGRILRLLGNSFTELSAFGVDVSSAVAVENGFVAVTRRERTLLYCQAGRSEPQRLELRAEGARDPAESPSSGVTGKRHRATLRYPLPRGRLLGVGGNRVVYAADDPYGLWRIELDGTVRELAPEGGKEPPPEASGLPLPTTFTRHGVTNGNTLLIDRSHSEVGSRDGQVAARFAGYELLWVDLDSGEVRQKLDLLTEGLAKKAVGDLVGMHGDDFVLYYHGDPAYLFFGRVEAAPRVVAPGKGPEAGSERAVQTRGK